MHSVLTRNLKVGPGIQLREKLDSKLKSWIPACRIGFPNSHDEFSFASNHHLKNVKFRFVHHADIMSVMDKSRFTLEISSQDLFVKVQRIEEV